MRTAALSLMTTAAIMLTATGNAIAEISWKNNLRTAHAQAQSEGKLLLLHFYTDNCSWCDKLEKGSFQAPLVGQAIGQSFVPVKIHANASPKLAEMFKVTKFPTDVIVTTDGKTLSHSVSPQDPARYAAMLTSTLPALVAAKTAAPTESVATNSQPNPVPAVASLSKATMPQTPSYAAAPSPTQASTAQASTTQASTTQASTNPSSTTLQIPTSDLSFQTQSPAGDGSGLELPTAALSSGVQAHLAGSRTDGLTLEMPEQVPAETTSAPVSRVTDAPSSANQTPISTQPELGMQGFCPVTVIHEDKWVEGLPEFGAIHLGKLYLFTSEANMKSFLADPVPYTPVLNEIDVVRFFEERKIVPGKREWGLKDPIHNRMFFFADEAAMNHFYNEYERYTDVAIEVMEKAVKDANPGT